MSWDGTVRCSECYKKGHNRSGCPRLKERYQEALAKPEGEREYYDDRIIREFEQKKQSNTNRKCSYCDEKGHNRRTCEILATHQSYVHRQEVAFRKGFLQHVQEIGLNVGALVDYKKEGNTQLSVVTNIHWHSISVTEAHDGISRFVTGRPIKNMVDDRAQLWFNLTAPDHWPVGTKWKPKDKRWQEESYSLKVLSSVPTEAKPPSGWLTDDKMVKELFKDRHSWQWPASGDSDTVNSYYSCDFWDLEKEQELEKIA